VFLKELWVPLSGAIAQQRSVETIANNVANANTPGFKRDDVTFREHLTALQKGVEDIDLPHKEWAPEDFYRSYGAEHSQVKVDANFTIFEQGQLTPTGSTFDIALNGNGMLEVLTPQGIRYTRAGSLSMTPSGELVTGQGHFVLSKLTQTEGDNLPSADARKITLTNAPLSINLQGEVFQNGQKVTDLSVVEFKDQHALRKEGTSLFVNKFSENLITDGSATSVHQGFIEQSNVNAVEEMAKLIKANRNFESIQRVIKTYDAISSKGVNEISKF
jgi:flagellar basal-body rod protein FlgF